MTAYVDDKQIPYGRMKMCHLLADTTVELEDMARTIGVDVRHIEHRGEPNEHLNVSQTYRTKAVKAGAVELDSRGLVKLIRKKRRLSPGDRAGVVKPEPEDEPEDEGGPWHSDADASLFSPTSKGE